MNPMSSVPKHIAPARPFGGWAIQSAFALLATITVALLADDPSFLIVTFIVALVAMALARFEMFVYATVFLLPWYPLLDVRLPVRDVSLILRLVLFAGVFVIRARRGASLRQWLWAGPLRKGIVILAAVATISLLTSSLPANLLAYRSLARLFSYLALFFGVVGWLETREQVDRIVKLLLVSTIGVALFGLYQSAADGYTDLYFRLYPTQEEEIPAWSGRITSLLFHFNSLAGYLNLVIPYALAFAVLAKSRVWRLVGMACLSTAGAALYLTGSRGGLVACSGILLVGLGCLVPRRTTLLRMLTATAMAAAVVVSLSWLPRVTTGREEVAARVKQVDEFTVETRMAIWGVAGSIFLAHPLLGIGYGNIPAVYGDYIPSDAPLHAHNLYLQYLAETGIVGFTALMILIGAFLRGSLELIRHRDIHFRIVGIGAVGGLIGALLHGMVDYLFLGAPQYAGLFWLVLALGVVALEASRKGPAWAPRAESR